MGTHERTMPKRSGDSIRATRCKRPRHTVFNARETTVGYLHGLSTDHWNGVFGYLVGTVNNRNGDRIGVHVPNNADPIGFRILNVKPEKFTQLTERELWRRFRFDRLSSPIYASFNDERYTMEGIHPTYTSIVVLKNVDGTSHYTLAPRRLCTEEGAKLDGTFVTIEKGEHVGRTA